jgi:hypothetical protein
MPSTSAPRTVNWDVRIPFRRHGRIVELTFEQAFAVAHYLWSNGRFEQAAQRFDVLSVVPGRGPKASIFLAHFRAMMSDYAGCSGLLHRVLDDEQFATTASALHEAFVMWKCGFYVEANEGLRAVVAKQTELPSVPLILAELLGKVGNWPRPPQLLTLALRRDRPNGAVAQIAKRLLPDVERRAEEQVRRRTNRATVRGRVTSRNDRDRQA